MHRKDIPCCEPVEVWPGAFVRAVKHQQKSIQSVYFFLKDVDMETDMMEWRYSNGVMRTVDIRGSMRSYGNVDFIPFHVFSLAPTLSPLPFAFGVCDKRLSRSSGRPTIPLFYFSSALIQSPIPFP